MRQGLDLSDCAAATRIRERYLVAIEDDRFESLPDPAYVNGFLRAYAAHLGVPFEGPERHLPGEGAVGRGAAARRARPGDPRHGPPGGRPPVALALGAGRRRRGRRRDRAADLGGRPELARLGPSGRRRGGRRRVVGRGPHEDAVGPDRAQPGRVHRQVAGLDGGDGAGALVEQHVGQRRPSESPRVAQHQPAVEVELAGGDRRSRSSAGGRAAAVASTTIPSGPKPVIDGPVDQHAPCACRRPRAGR